jgi:positive phototaxis protein PixI
MSDFANFSGSFVPSLGLTQTAAQTSTEFLRLRLAPQIPVLLPIQQLAEVLNVPENQIMPIPDSPAWVMGVHNWRGEILWVVDLGHLCGLKPWYQQPINRAIYSAVVLNGNNSATSLNSTFMGAVGLVVRQVEEIESFNLKLVQPTLSSSLTGVSSELAAFATGYWQKSDHEVLTILNTSAILNAMST